MAKNNNLTDFLTDTANAIRTKKGTTAKINPQNFSSEIASIQTGVDTSDATATADDILLVKTAYAKGEKLTGTIETYAGEGGAMNISIDNKAGKTLYTQGKYCAENIVVTPVLEEVSVTPTTAKQTKEPSTGKAGISKVTVEKIPDEYVIPQGSITITENGPVDVTGLASVTVSVPSEKQQLSAPTIELSGANIEITDKNGIWADRWKISNGTDTYISTDSVKNLSTIFQSAAVGQYSITAIASNSENKMSDSAASNSVSWSIYSVSYTLSNCTATTKPTKAYQGADTTIILSANTNYALPDSVSVSGATIKSYSKSTGTLVLTNATGAITVSCTAVQSVFTITANLSNCTADSTNPTTINKGGVASLIFTANEGYQLPASVTVSGATYTWEQSTGMLDLSNPTANVTITIAATQIPQLATPQNVSASGTTVSWNAVENAESYDVYVDNTLYENTTSSQKSYDLSTSSKWSALSDGEHTVQIVAKGTGYRDSEKSTSVTVTKGGSTGETWILNLSIQPGSQSYNFTDISFTSNNQNFDRLYYKRQFVDIGILYYFLNGTEKEVYSFNDGIDFWSDGDVYRIITFETAPTGDLLTWLQENGTKQGPLINFTIDGTSYQAGQGMTWHQWVKTPYNTGDFSVDLGDDTVENGTKCLYTSSNMQLVNSSDTIISGGAYTFAEGGAGN